MNWIKKECATSSYKLYKWSQQQQSRSRRIPPECRVMHRDSSRVAVDLHISHLGQMLLQVLRGIEGSRKAKATHIESDGVSLTAGIDHRRRRKRLRGTRNEFRTNSGRLLWRLCASITLPPRGRSRRLPQRSQRQLGEKTVRNRYLK